jgi:hypothetical protein
LKVESSDGGASGLEISVIILILIKQLKMIIKSVNFDNPKVHLYSLVITQVYIHIPRKFVYIYLDILKYTTVCFWETWGRNRILVKVIE